MKPHRYIIGRGVLCGGNIFLNDGAILVDYGQIAAARPIGMPVHVHVGESPDDLVETLRFQFLSLRARGADTSPLQEAIFSHRRDVRKHHFPATEDLTVASRADIAVLDYIPVTPIDDSDVLAHMMP